MKLPTDAHAQWPPKEVAEQYAKFAEWSAWYSGDAYRLTEVYAGNNVFPGYVGQPTIAALTAPVPWWRFWGRASKIDGIQRAQLHIPVASDLAGVSGALLFGEQPRVWSTSKGDKTAEERLRTIMDDGMVGARLVEAAETGAAMGGVYIYPAWDEEVASFPIMAVAQADSALPTFQWGILTSVLFHRIVYNDGNEIWRHMELHERQPGKNAHILHALYRGSPAQIGQQVSLQSLVETAGFLAEVDLPFKELDVHYLPNIRPNRLWRNSPLGVSDYQGGEGLLDALDEVYASWMRDIRLAKARIIVPREFLDEKGAFAVDQEIYAPVDMDPTSSTDTRSILANQFEIRVTQHRDTAADFIERIVSNAGYAPQTFGLHMEGRSETGTALRVRERKTLLTLKRKAAGWGPELALLFEQMQQIDKVVLKTKNTGEPFKPSVELADSIMDDPLTLSQTAQALRAANAASTEVLVRMLHPDWPTAEVDAEVKRIEESIKAAKPAPPIVQGPNDQPGMPGNMPPGSPTGAPNAPGGVPPKPADNSAPVAPKPSTTNPSA